MSRPIRDWLVRAAGLVRNLPRTKWSSETIAVTVLVGLAVVGALIAVPLLRARSRATEAHTLTYTQLLAAIERKELDSLQVRPGSEIRGWSTRNQALARIRVVYPSTDVAPLLARAEAARINVRFEEPPKDVQGYLAMALSIAVGFAMLLLVRRQVLSVGVDTEAGENTTSALTFADVAGNSAAIADLKEIVAFLKEPQRFAAMGARIPKGLLLEGPPGTGKTLMARALAGEAGVPCFVASGSDFTGSLVGQGVQRIKSLFKKARKAGGAVIFIDEIDTLGGRRGRPQGHNEDDRTLNQFLVELDGFDPTVGLVVVGATNRAGDLDPALLRQGRFDRSVSVSLPTVSERAEILALHVRNRAVPLAADVDLTRLARLMTGSSGAELEGLVNEAAILAVKSHSTEVTWSHLEEARDRILLGRAREGLSVSDAERRLIALHEAGHALAGVVFCPKDPLHKVTIQPRGAAMGVAFFQPDHETHMSSREYLEGQIRKGLGGRAAEELFYGSGKITSGAASDLQQCTRIAKQMVYRLGMGPTTGLITFDPDSGPVSGETHSRMDNDVRAILDEAYTSVLECLRRNQASLEALAQALLDEETLSGDEAIGVMRQAGL
jgi:cell division protease FtsH